MALQGNKKLIYWADDDMEDMETFEQVLAGFAPDYEIVNFENGKLLVDRLVTLKPGNFPNLIVLDISMPVLNGIDTLIHLSREKKYDLIPRVIFTTSQKSEEKELCESMNTKMFTKPFSLTELNQALRTIISYARVAD